MAIYQEKDKRKCTKDGRSWYYLCYYKNLYGENKRKKSKLFKTKKEASEEERIFLNSVKNAPLKSNMTIGSLKEVYLNYKKDSVRISSYESTKVSLKHIDILEKVAIDELNINHIQNWKKYINEKNLATGYKNTIYKNLRAMLNYGNKMYDLNINILNKMTNFTNPNEVKKEMLFYTKEEFDNFISYESDLKWICFFSALFYCGLRQGEALALNWNDINFENNTIRINKSLANRVKGSKFLILPPKTRGSNRTIPIPLSLAKKLKIRYNEQKKYTNFSNDWFIFGDIFPLATTTIQKRRDKLVALSGVKRIRIHDFRHSCASLLISKGANITLIAKYLGHDDVSTTLNTYSHFYKNDLSNLIESVDL